MFRACNPRVSLLISLFLCGIWAATGQSRTDLQSLIEKNKREIALTREILKETQNQKVASLQLLNVYQRQIEQRKSLIGGISNEVSSLEGEIEIARQEISAITNELNEMKEDFSQLVTDGYKARKNYSQILFLFSSNSFNDILKRMNYLRKLLDYRKLQLELIIRKQQENSAKINALIHKKNEKLILLNRREEEQNDLINDQDREEQIIRELKEKESDLALKLRNKQQQAQQLDKLVMDAIEREKNVDKSGTAVAAVKGDFGRNVGKLSWPVKSGYISEGFGVHKHQELKNITTENNGINIATSPGSEIFPVFAGTVSAIMEVPGLKTSLLIKHEGYYTVYANLEEVFVKRGQAVGTATRIGRVVKNNEGLAELHFEVWKGSDKLNPENWLAPR